MSVTSSPPEGVPRVPTYKARQGRVTRGQADALARLWPLYGVPVDGRPLDLEVLFGRTAPLVLEIGCGMGEATALMAEAEPERDLLAVDVHTPGLGSLLRQVDERGLGHVRVAQGDARVLLADMLGPGSLAEVRAFFPDPWPKTRHRKRRLVTPAFCDLLARRLVPGALLHLATDWAPYAEALRAVLGGHEAFSLTDDVPWRPVTRFEQRGVEEGRPAQDVVARRH
ncbi:MAG: tRNA (guanosine(46)-N7)-methyltransferase TrmB [Actinomycetes bacterium]